MAAEVRMPEVLAGVTEATISSWTVAVGDSVSVGATIAEIETDKAVVDYAAEVAGTVLQLLVEPGSPIAVGTPIAVIGEPGEVVDAGHDDDGATASGTGESWADAAAAAPLMAESPVAAAPAAPAESVIDTDSPRRFASPLVRRLARERGIDLASIVGSGPQGRVVRRDLDSILSAAPAEPTAPAAPAPVAAAPAPAGADVEAVPLSRMRQTIARRLTEAKQQVPHFYLVAECCVDRLWSLRQEINESSDVRISVNDFVVKAAAVALAAVPEANATWGGDVIHQHRAVDLAIAVSIEGGLMTPVLRGADRLSLGEIARSTADLAERSRAGKLRQSELEGGSFSISNLGMYGTREFSAIINPPHSGILAVGAVREAPVVEDGQLAVGRVMTVTLSADHRVVDGAVAAQWLAAFTANIENPLRMLI